MIIVLKIFRILGHKLKNYEESGGVKRREEILRKGGKEERRDY